MRSYKNVYLIICLVFVLVMVAGCAAPPARPTPASTSTPTPTPTPSPSPTLTSTPIPTTPTGSVQIPGPQPIPPPLVPDCLVVGKVALVQSRAGNFPWEIDIEVYDAKDVPGYTGVSGIIEYTGQILTVWTKEDAARLKGQVISAYVRRDGTLLEGMSTTTYFYKARDFRLATAQPPTPTTTPSYGFSISFPKGWVNVTRMAGGIFGVATPERLPRVVVSLIGVEPGKTAAQVYSGNFNYFIWGQRTFKDDAKLISQGDAVLKDGTPAYAYVYSGYVQSSWQKPENCTGKTLIIVAKGTIGTDRTKGFTITGSATSDLYKKQEALIDEVLYSFHVE